MEIANALEFAGTNRQSVLVTTRANGRPQLSNVFHSVGDGLLRVSITVERAKYANLRRDPWAALHVTKKDFWSYAVLEGPVELSAVATDPGDAVVEELIAHYRAVAGEHEDWDAYRQAQVAEHRVVVRLRPDRAYGVIR